MKENTPCSFNPFATAEQKRAKDTNKFHDPARHQSFGKDNEGRKILYEEWNEGEKNTLLPFPR